MSYSFGASAQPQQQMQPQQQPAQGGFDIQAYIQAMQQIAIAQQQTRLQAQREQQSGQHFGMSGGNINPQTGREAGNPFDTGFFQSGAAQLNPEAAMRSQGDSAVNQWNHPGQFGWASPPNETKAEGAANASRPPFQISPESSALVHGYTAPPPMPSDNIYIPSNGGQAEQQLDPRGGFSNNNFRPIPRALPMPRPQPQPQQPVRPQPFGASGRPGRSFSFGAGM